MMDSHSVSDLVRCCREETARYYHHESYNERFCFELFRRAVVGRDNEAWDALHSEYGGVVRRWLGRDMDPDEGVAATFERFWQGVDAAKFARFSSLAAILGYLKMCAHSVVVDKARLVRAAALQQSLDTAVALQSQEDVAETVVGQVAAGALWQEIQDVLIDEGERLVLYLSYIIGLSPREIQARHSGRFVSVTEIYHIKRMALDRLRRTPRFQSLR